MDLQKIMEDATRQVPALVVLVILVVIFVRYMQHRDSLIKEIHKEHLLARQETRDALKENSGVLQANTSAIEHLSNAVDRLKLHTQ